MRAAHKLSFISMEIGCEHDRLIARSQVSRKQGFNQSPIRKEMLPLAKVALEASALGDLKR
jgi:hypothetical protein